MILVRARLLTTTSRQNNYSWKEGGGGFNSERLERFVLTTNCMFPLDYSYCMLRDTFTFKLGNLNLFIIISMCAFRNGAF